MLRNATRLARRGGWLAIALLAAMLIGPAQPAGAQQPKVPLDGTKPLPGDCAQACFDAYVANLERCVQAHCASLLFITWWCDDDALDACFGNADAVFDACVDACR